MFGVFAPQSMNNHKVCRLRRHSEGGKRGWVDTFYCWTSATRTQQRQFVQRAGVQRAGPLVALCTLSVKTESVGPRGLSAASSDEKSLSQRKRYSEQQRTPHPPPPPALGIAHHKGTALRASPVTSAVTVPALRSSRRRWKESSVPSRSRTVRVTSAAYSVSVTTPPALSTSCPT